jgi:hypothetical protein
MRDVGGPYWRVRPLGRLGCQLWRWEADAVEGEKRMIVAIEPLNRTNRSAAHVSNSAGKRTSPDRNRRFSDQRRRVRCFLTQPAGDLDHRAVGQKHPPAPAGALGLGPFA